MTIVQSLYGFDRPVNTRYLVRNIHHKGRNYSVIFILCQHYLLVMNYVQCTLRGGVSLIPGALLSQCLEVGRPIYFKLSTAYKFVLKIRRSFIADVPNPVVASWLLW